MADGRIGVATHHAADDRSRAALGADSALPDEALTLREAALLVGINLRTVEHGVARARLRTVRVRGRRVTTRPWLRAWVEVWYPDQAGRV